VYGSQVNNNEEANNDWLKSEKAITQYFSKNAFFSFYVLSGSA